MTQTRLESIINEVIFVVFLGSFSMQFINAKNFKPKLNWDNFEDPKRSSQIERFKADLRSEMSEFRDPKKVSSNRYLNMLFSLWSGRVGPGRFTFSYYFPQTHPLRGCNYIFFFLYAGQTSRQNKLK